MIGKQKKKPNADSLASLGNAPVNAFTEAKFKFLELHGSSKVEGSRWFAVSILLLLVCISQGLAISKMLPLKTAVPYMVTLSKEKGVSAEIVDAKNYRPDENVKIFFLTRFIENMRQLDPYLTATNIRSAFAVTRDKASIEFTDYVTNEKPNERLAADRNLTRTIKFLSVNPGTQENIAFIRVRETERTGVKESSKNYMFTLHYEIVPPTDFAMIQKNPAGIYITHFDKREEVESN